MRYALIDDATLEAAKRMEGKAVTRNTLAVAGDILALDNLIQAILYYDQVLYLDLNRSKKNYNSGFFKSFQQVRLNEEHYNKLLLLTNKMTDEYLPCIEGGQFTDECFCAFFKALDMDIRFVWEKKGGIFCLTPRIIRKEKNPGGMLHKKLLNMVLSERSDKSLLSEINSRIPLLYDSGGQIINNCYIVKDRDGKGYPTKLSRQADALFEAMNYMAFRSNLHLIAAKELKADLILSPVRSIFQRSGFNRLGLGNKGVMQEIPLFSFWIAEHMQESSGFIGTAYELREEKEFVTARRYLNEIDEMAETGCTCETGPMDPILLKLNRQFGRIAKKYRVDSGKASSAAPFALIGRIPLSRFDAVTSKINYKTEAVLQNIKFGTDEADNVNNGRIAPM